MVGVTAMVLLKDRTLNIDKLAQLKIIRLMLKVVLR